MSGGENFRAHIEQFTPEQREAWAERAAIMEHDGKMARERAEREAYYSTCRACGLMARPKQGRLTFPGGLRDAAGDETNPARATPDAD